MAIRLGKLRWFDGAINLTSYTDGAYDALGDWIDGVPTVVQIEGNIQPFVMQGELTKVVPDGLYTDDAKTLFTQAEVKTVDQYGMLEADTVLLNTQVYVAFKILNYTHTQMNLFHHQVLLLRRKE